MSGRRLRVVRARRAPVGVVAGDAGGDDRGERVGQVGVHGLDDGLPVDGQRDRLPERLSRRGPAC